MPPDPLSHFAQQWLALWDPRSLRKRWLADMSSAVDRTLRSPVFLEVIRFNLVTMTRSAGRVFPFFRR